MYGMNLIRRAFDTAMSRGSPELFPDLFGPFLASIDTFEVWELPHSRSKPGSKLLFQPVKMR